jgi:hypothetical protein
VRQWVRQRVTALARIRASDGATGPAPGSSTRSSSERRGRRELSTSSQRPSPASATSPRVRRSDEGAATPCQESRSLSRHWIEGDERRAARRSCRDGRCEFRVAGCSPALGSAGGTTGGARRSSSLAPWRPTARLSCLQSSPMSSSRPRDAGRGNGAGRGDRLCAGDGPRIASRGDLREIAEGDVRRGHVAPRP